jgi:hypothetical protein
MADDNTRNRPARRDVSISRLLAEPIDALVAVEHAWKRSERSALVLLEQGFPYGRADCGWAE